MKSTFSMYHSMRSYQTERFLRKVQQEKERSMSPSNSFLPFEVASDAECKANKLKKEWQDLKKTLRSYSNCGVISSFPSASSKSSLYQLRNFTSEFGFHKPTQRDYSKAECNINISIFSNNESVNKHNHSKGNSNPLLKYSGQQTQIISEYGEYSSNIGEEFETEIDTPAINKVKMSDPTKNIGLCNLTARQKNRRGRQFGECLENGRNPQINSHKKENAELIYSSIRTLQKKLCKKQSWSISNSDSTKKCPHSQLHKKENNQYEKKNENVAIIENRLIHMKKTKSKIVQKCIDCR